jgi:hypothetical protein
MQVHEQDKTIHTNNKLINTSWSRMVDLIMGNSHSLFREIRPLGGGIGLLSIICYVISGGIISKLQKLSRFPSGKIAKL